MRENSTKPSNVQQTKAINTANDLRDSVDTATRFINRFGIVKLLGDFGAYKEKGVPVRVILLYIFNLMFSPMSMYYQLKMGAFHEDFSKNTVYRFLGNIHMNWHLFMLRLSTIIIRHVVGLTEDKNNRYALLVDDTPLPKCGKAMELVSRYFKQAAVFAPMEHERWIRDHQMMGWVYGKDYETVPLPKNVTHNSPEGKALRQARREQMRCHKLAMDGTVTTEDIRDHYFTLSEEDQDKDWKPFNSLLKLLKKFDGLRIYKLD